jgi:ATP-binding cassette subfamily B protein RaxB
MERECAAGDIRHLGRAWVLPHPDRNEPGLAPMVRSDEIEAMPMGYHTLIGSMGASLSGGQKQRILLARALYKRPKLLFLDEATSALDVDRERLVNQAVAQLQLTRVIVAHRPETIASADRVIVLQQGAAHTLQQLQGGGGGPRRERA